jgi:hypothetical protein
MIAIIELGDWRMVLGLKMRLKLPHRAFLHLHLRRIYDILEVSELVY